MTHTIRVPRSLSERMASGTLVTPAQPSLARPQPATPASGTATPQWPAASSHLTVPPEQWAPANNGSLPSASGMPTVPQRSTLIAPGLNPTTPSTSPLGVPASTPPAANTSGPSPTASETPTSWAAGVYRRRSELLDVGSVTGLGTSGSTVSSFRTAPIPGSSIARFSTTDRAWSDATVPVNTTVSPSIDTVT